MEMKHLILFLVLIFLSHDISTSSASVALAPSSFSFSEPQGDQTFSILPTDVDPMLQRICGDTDHPIECLTTIIPFLGEKVAIDPVSILKVEIEATDGKAKEALEKASKLLLDPSTSKSITFCLETCIDNYNAILDSKQRVLDSISMGDANQLSLELSSNVDNVYACEDAFKEADIMSPIIEMDSLLGKMITNSLTIGLDLVHLGTIN